VKSSQNKAELWTVKRMAAMLGLSEYRLSELAREHGLPCDMSGRSRRYKPDEVIPWYIAYKSKAGTIRDELTQEQVKWQRLKTEQLTGTLVDIESAYAIMSRIVLLVARGLEGMAAELSHELDTEGQKAVKAACRSLRGELESQIEQIDFSEATGSDHEAAEESKHRGLGRDGTATAA